MIRTLRNLARLTVILRTLGRHDALFPEGLGDVAPGYALLASLLNRRNRAGGPDSRPRPGQRLAAALAELGPSFIKLGQILSTRSDLVGSGIAADLAQLQDKLPPFSGREARRIIEEELGQPVERLFLSFEDTPIAAASIAQVHLAVLAPHPPAPHPPVLAGEPVSDPVPAALRADTLPERPPPEPFPAEAPQAVAVKVLRPGIEHAFRRDLDLFRWLADLALWLQPRLKRLRPHEVIDIFAGTVNLEMDLRMEAAAASELAGNFRGDPTFNVPRIDWDRTSRRVLTLERVHGIKVDEVDRIREAGFDPDEVLAKASAAFFNQVFRDGFFHADLHPGNLFVDTKGDIVAVDFGIMGRLDRPTRTYLADMLLGFLNGDYRRVAQVHFDAGYVPAHQSIDTFTQACRAIGEPLMNKPLHEISLGRLLAQLFAVTEQFQMETQPQLLLLQKSMLTAEGVGRALNPRVNMWELTRPLIEDWMRENRGPEARLADDMQTAVRLLRDLPSALRQAERLARMLTEAGLKAHPATLDEFLTRYGAKRQRITWRVFIATAVLLSVLAAMLA